MMPEDVPGSLEIVYTHRVPEDVPGSLEIVYTHRVLTPKAPPAEVKGSK